MGTHVGRDGDSCWLAMPIALIIKLFSLTFMRLEELTDREWSHHACPERVEEDPALLIQFGGLRSWFDRLTTNRSWRGQAWQLTFLSSRLDGNPVASATQGNPE